MTGPAAPRWHRRGGGFALGMLAVVVLGVGLGFGRADVALLGLPLAATAASALRRPDGRAATALVQASAEQDAVVVEVSVAAPAGAELVVLAAAAYREPPAVVVVSAAVPRPASRRGCRCCTAGRRRCCGSAGRSSRPRATWSCRSPPASRASRSCRRGRRRPRCCCRTG